jgi:hypothetical protein
MCSYLMGTNVNHTPVKDAWCWWYRKYALGVSATRPRGSYLRVDQLVGVKELERWPNNLGLVNPSSGITKTWKAQFHRRSPAYTTAILPIGMRFRS